MGDSLKGRVAIVTGSSRGIGRAIAERFGAEGATVVLAARSAQQSANLPGTLTEAAAAIEALGGKAVSIASDVTDPASRENLVAETIARLGRLDILVNSAGRSIHSTVSDFTSENLLSQIAQYLTAPMDLARLAIPHMRKGGAGWIVNIGSATAKMPEAPLAGFHATEGLNVYGALKAALNRFTVGLAAELLDSNIAAHVLAPVGAIVTPGYASHGTVERDAAYLEPMEDIVEAALALVSHPATQSTGEIAYSYQYLDRIGRSTRSLDGSEIVTPRPHESRPGES